MVVGGVECSLIRTFNTAQKLFKMMLVLASLAVLFLAPATGQGLVKVGFYGEALCPDCINFINGPLTVAFNQVRTIKYKSLM